MDTLVSTQWLRRQLGQPDLVALDCSVRTKEVDGGLVNVSGLADYRREHIPTAGFADLKGALCDHSEVEFGMPSPQAFCQEMGRLGVGDRSRVVLYDRATSAWAARVWWMLRWVGFDCAAILDGGLRDWKAEGYPVSTEPANRQPQTLTLRPRPELIVDRQAVSEAINDPSVRVIDALPAALFRGDVALFDRPGHIPGAENICGLDLLDENGRYRSHAELEALHPGDRSAPVITYCGSGILASSNAFVMTRLGFRDVAVYAASLQEWAADPANPMVTDAS